MKAIIVAAGLGSRLKHLTQDTPKCLLKFGGKPIMGYQLTSLLENGIKDLVIVIGYKGHLIKEFIQNHPTFKDLNVTFVENPDYATTSTGYSRSAIVNSP